MLTYSQFCLSYYAIGKIKIFMVKVHFLISFHNSQLHRYTLSQPPVKQWLVTSAYALDHFISEQEATYSSHYIGATVMKVSGVMRYLYSNVMSTKGLSQGEPAVAI